MTYSSSPYDSRIISFQPGSSKPLVIKPEQDDGTSPADLTDVLSQLRIKTGDACVLLSGEYDADLEAFSFNLNQLADLPPRMYYASVDLDWGDGWEELIELNLIVEGGC